MNITRRCNLICKHFDVHAGPERIEMTRRETTTHCISPKFEGFSA